MVDHKGHYSQLAAEAVEHGSFHDIALTDNKSVRAIPSAQFFRSLANNLRTRMLTTTSRRGESQETTSDSVNRYDSLLKEISVLDSSLWPVNFHEVSRFGEKEIESLANRFHVDSQKAVRGFRVFKARFGKISNDDLQPVIQSLEAIPVSTADCERSFSVMNDIVSNKRNRLEIETLSSLMFIEIQGPPINSFKPEKYASGWLRKGRHSACDVNAMRRKAPETDSESFYNHMFPLF